jgi:hypothetical protein
MSSVIPNANNERRRPIITISMKTKKTGLAIKTGLKAGGLSVQNHNRTLRSTRA